MATAGPNAPGTMADDNSVGTTAWANPGNVASSNNTYANADPAYSAEYVPTHYLKCTNFGFAIPAGATIDGVTVSIERRDDLAKTRDKVVSLVKGGGVSGDNKQNSVSFWTDAISDETITYGGAADLWGLALTYSDVNASDFGVVLQAETLDDEDVGAIAKVDFISITITYTAGGGGGLSIPVAMHSYRRRRV